MNNRAVHTLMDARDSVLMVIDVQDYFLSKLPENERHILTQRIEWLARVSALLDIPILTTAENIERFGGISDSLMECLPEKTPTFDKMIFGLAAAPEIMEAVRKTQRHTIVLTGLETDVCVAQSAIGLLNEGYSVAAVSDACGSPGTGHATGLQRMQHAGIALVTAKSLYYEWIRTVKEDNEFMKKYEKEIGLPEGILL